MRKSGVGRDLSSVAMETIYFSEDRQDSIVFGSTIPSESNAIRKTFSCLKASRAMLNPRLRLCAFLGFGTLFMVVMVTGMSKMKVRPTVHVAFPASTSNRKVRMYTDYPDLALLSKTHSSLSLVSRLQLIDAKQCVNGPTNCLVSVVCYSTMEDTSSVNCRCRTGYFFKDWSCRPCSTRCGTNEYLASRCTDMDDAVCKPCSMCGPTQYAAARCTTDRDTICIDVSFPIGILPLNRSDLDDDGISISVSHSPNVFLERLIDMQRLDTPMYVTNNQQILDFVWERPSGMDISVSVTGVYLIPTYNDMEAVDDTMLFNQLRTVSNSFKQAYTRVQEKYCRHPVPDYYFLQLEKIADRIAAASVVRCDSQDKSIPACPNHLRDGDRYIKWDINKKCPKHPSQNLTQLNNGYNSVVCTEETELLRKIFHRIRPNTLEWKFPTEDCERFRMLCEKCIKNADCKDDSKLNASSIFGLESQKECCAVDCYNKTFCQYTYNDSCPPAEVECAIGEVNIFALYPVFNSMEHEFTCHLKYKQPQYLYNISYSIQIPSINYNSTERHFYVSSKTRKEHLKKASKFDFMNITHETRIPIEEEIMLIGDLLQLSPYANSMMKPFTIRRLKKPSQLAKLTEYHRDDTGHTTYVQFERPFLYSSQSWYRNGCHKNLSQIYPNQTLTGLNYISVEAKQGFHGPEFTHDPDQHPKHSYQLYRRKTQPLIKFVTTEKTSVLKHLQGRDIKGNLIPNTLFARVTWHYETNTWKLVVSGSQDICPSIIGIKIFTQLMTGCAGNFDIFINCPNDFTVTFNFSTTKSDLPDIFVLQINDSMTSHHMVLSSMYVPVLVDEIKSQNEARAQRQLSSADDHRKNFVALWQPTFFILAVSAIVFFGIIIMYHYVNMKARTPETSAADGNPEQETVALNNHREKQNESPISSQSEQPKLKLSMYLFAGVYLVYSVVFTFSLTFLLVYMAHSAYWGKSVLSEMSQSDIQINVNKSIQQIKDHERAERSRLFSNFRERREACVRHLEAENKKLLLDYQQTTQKQMDAIFIENGTLHFLSNKIQQQNVSAYMTQINDFISNCNKTVHSIVQRFEANYFDFLKKAVSNPWLQVPQQIFLIQDGEDPSRQYLTSNQIKQFASWMEIDKVEELLAVDTNVAHRLSQVTLPSVSAVEITFPSVTPQLATSLPDISHVPQEFQIAVVKPDHNDTSTHTVKADRVNQPRLPRSVDRQDLGFGVSGNLNRNLDHAMNVGILERDRRGGVSQGHPDDHNDNIGRDEDEAKWNENREDKRIYDSPNSNNDNEGKERYVNKYPDTSNFKNEDTSDQKKSMDIFLADDPSQSLSSKFPQSTRWQQSPSSRVSSESENNICLYILVGVFLFLDMVLFAYRLSWLCNQLYAAKHGYADRIPTDEACKQVLEIQTAYHLPAFDNSLDTSVGYYVDGKDQLYVTEPEREGDIVFLQSFPKTKDDILQRIFNEKLNQAEERRLRSIQRCIIWRWCSKLRAVVQHMFLSQLLWQTAVTLMAIVFICVFIYCIEFWLTAENFRTLIGGQSATSDVQWQLDTSDRYLHTLAYQLSTELGRMRVLCDMEVNTLTETFFTTLNMQTSAITSSLQHLCHEALNKNCDKYVAFRPSGGRIVGCNFLPLQAQTFQDLNLSSIENQVSGEVMPFLTVSRRVMATSSVVFILMLCLRLLCQAGASTARHYFLLTGRLPRIKVYQSEEQSLKHGVCPTSSNAMQRSQSWVDSCESGVYVGEGEDATANKEEIPKSA